MEGSGPHMTTFLHAGKGTAQSLKLAILIARIPTSVHYIYTGTTSMWMCFQMHRIHYGIYYIYYHQNSKVV